MVVAPRPVEGCTWIARWKNLSAVSCSFWREKQLPTTQHVYLCRWIWREVWGLGRDPIETQHVYAESRSKSTHRLAR